MIIGIDEVGRGCWAGPLLVVAARARGPLPKGLADSKKLSRKQRQEIFELLADGCDFGEGWVEAEEIDSMGLSGAMRLAVARALGNLKAELDSEIIMDGLINYCAPEFVKVKCVAKADSLHPIVSAASVYAKVKRDLRMAELSEVYPDYGFDKHVGYGTKAHLQALSRNGPTPLHRRSYKPVQQFVIS